MAVEVGDEAPDFELDDQHKQPVKLSSFRGKKNVVLVFYPWAFSRICGGEMCALRDSMPQYQNDDVQVLAVSIDSPFTLRAWADKEGFDYPLLSDAWPHGDVARKYGVFNEISGAADRGTFIIDKDGVVRWTVRNGIPDARDLDDYAKALAQL